VAFEGAAFSGAPHSGNRGGAVLDHYSATLEEIGRTGFVAFWKREFRPYLRAAAEQFAPEHVSVSMTERFMRRGGRSRKGDSEHR